MIAPPVDHCHATVSASARAIGVTGAAVALLLMVAVSLPGFLLWPFLPVTRRETGKRIELFIRWTAVILDGAGGAATRPTGHRGRTPYAQPARPARPARPATADRFMNDRQAGQLVNLDRPPAD